MNPDADNVNPDVNHGDFDADNVNPDVDVADNSSKFECIPIVIDEGKQILFKRWCLE